MIMNDPMRDMTYYLTNLAYYQKLNSYVKKTFTFVLDNLHVTL